MNYMGGRKWAPQDLISSMDKAGIDYALVITLESTGPNSLPMTEEEKELVFWENAQEIFNFEIM